MKTCTSESFVFSGDYVERLEVSQALGASMSNRPDFSPEIGDLFTHGLACRSGGRDWMLGRARVDMELGREVARRRQPLAWLRLTLGDRPPDLSRHLLMEIRRLP
jgi:hypothetical protein